MRRPEEATTLTPQTCSRCLGRGTAFGALELANNTQFFDGLHTFLPALRSRSSATHGCALQRAPRGHLSRGRCGQGVSRRPRSTRRSSRCHPHSVGGLSAEPPQLPQQRGPRTLIQAGQPCAPPQADKHIEAGATMGRPVPRPRGHPRRGHIAYATRK
jgi:hypothetical protein